MRSRVITVCLLLIIFLLVALGLSLLGLSYLISFDLARTQLDAFERDGSATLFTLPLFEKIVFGLRIVGIVLLFNGGAIYVARRLVSQYLFAISDEFISFCQEIWQQFREAFAEEQRVHWGILVIILILAIWVRYRFLFQPMRYDEALTFNSFASRPLFVGLSFYPAPNNHLFHTLLVHIAYLLLGNKPWVIRLPAFLAGILLIPTSYMVTRIFYNKYSALLSAGIVASSSALVEYSTNARGYTLVSLIFLLILVLGKYLLARSNSFVWLAFAILSALGFYTIPIMLYPFGGVITWLFLSWLFGDLNRPFYSWLKGFTISIVVVGILTFILYIPVMIASGLKAVIGNEYVIPATWPYFWTEFPSKLSIAWLQWHRDLPVVVTVLFVIGFITSLVLHKRLTNHRVPIILAVVFWCGLVLIIHRKAPFARVWLFLLPLYITLVSAGIIYLLRLLIGKTNHNNVIFLILPLVLSGWFSFNVINSQSVYYSDETGTLRDAEQIALFLKNYLEDQDKILAITPSNTPLTYYFNLHHISTEYFDVQLDSSQRIIVVANKPKQSLEEVLDKENVPIARYGQPRLIKQYASADLYELNRIK